MDEPCRTPTGQDPWEFERNRRRYTLEWLAPYQNQWVAWNWNATRILAHHADPVELVRLIAALGVGSDLSVTEFIPAAEESASQL